MVVCVWGNDGWDLHQHPWVSNSGDGHFSFVLFLSFLMFTFDLKG